MKSHGLHAVPLFLRKQLDLIALHHAVKASVRTQDIDGGRGHMRACGEVLNGDEVSVLPRLDDCLRRLLPHAGKRGKWRKERVLVQDEFFRVGRVEVDVLAGEAAQVHLPS